jgi:hypothetical protein
MSKLARVAVIRHHCDCVSATVPPGEDGVEHVFTLDGVEFPWHISEEGPRVRKLEGLYAIDVTIPVEDVDVDGVEIADATLPRLPVSGLTDAIRVAQIEKALTAFHDAIGENSADIEYQRYVLLKRAGYLVNTP